MAGEDMLLSIEKVLQLLSEGKSVEKIAEMSGAEAAVIYGIIEEARNIIIEYDRPKSRKKVILRKIAPLATGGTATQENLTEEEIFDGAEISTVPVGSSLMIYTDGASSGNPGPAGIGIVINDGDGRQVGKVSSNIGVQTNNFAEYTALVRAMKIAIYFKTKSLNVRTDSELVVKQINGDYRVKNENIRPLYDEAIRLKKHLGSFKIEHVSRNFNDKADYLARKASKENK
jgi:ribonuclease HI